MKAVGKPPKTATKQAPPQGRKVRNVSIKVDLLGRMFHGSTTLLYGMPKCGKSSIVAALDAHIIALDPSGYKHLPICPAVEIFDPESDMTEFEQAVRDAPQDKLLVVDSITSLCQRFEYAVAKEFGVRACMEVDYGKAKHVRNQAICKVVQLCLAHPAGCLLIAHTVESEWKKKITLKPLWIDSGISNVLEAQVCSIIYYGMDRVLHTCGMDLAGAQVGSNNPFVESQNGMELTKADLGL